MAYQAVLQARYEASKKNNKFLKTLREAVKMVKYDGPYKAICINADQVSGLTEGKEYIVYNNTSNDTLYIVYGDDDDQVTSFDRHRFELVAAQPKFEILDDGKTNPRIIVSEKRFTEFLKQVAREAGYGDREISLCQVGINKGKEDFQYFWTIPEIVLMVSNIKDTDVNS